MHGFFITVILLGSNVDTILSFPRGLKNAVGNSPEIMTKPARPNLVWARMSVCRTDSFGELDEDTKNNYISNTALGANGNTKDCPIAIKKYY